MHWWPPVKRRRTIFAPIRPRPIIPSCTSKSSFARAHSRACGYVSARAAAGCAMISSRRLRAECREPRRRPQPRQVAIEQVPDMLDRHVRRREGAEHLRVVRIDALAREYGRHALSPEFFDRRQDTQLVVNKNVMLGRIAPLDVVEGLFLVDIDQHVSIDGVGETRTLDLARLEDDVAVRQDNGRTAVAQPLQHLEGAREQPVGERIIDQERGHRQQLDLARMFDPVTLEGSDIVAIAQLREQILEDPPVALAGGAAKDALQMVLQILLYPIVVEQRIVHINEEDDRVRKRHAASPAQLWRRRPRWAAGLPRRALINWRFMPPI